MPYGLGTTAITAVYNGDAGDAPGVGSTTFTVGKDATTTIVAPTVAAPPAGQPIVLNAVVLTRSPGAGTPTGTVTFRFGPVASWTVPLRTVGGLTYATLPLAPLPPGVYTFTAVYNGDAGDLISSSSTTFPVVAAKPALVVGAAVPAAPSTPSSSNAAASAPASTALRSVILTANARAQAEPARSAAWLAALDAVANEEG